MNWSGPNAAVAAVMAERSGVHSVDIRIPVPYICHQYFRALSPMDELHAEQSASPTCTLHNISKLLSAHRARLPPIASHPDGLRFSTADSWPSTSPLLRRGAHSSPPSTLRSSLPELPSSLRPPHLSVPPIAPRGQGSCDPAAAPSPNGALRMCAQQVQRQRWRTRLPRNPPACLQKTCKRLPVREAKPLYVSPASDLARWQKWARAATDNN
jgi:hypothetical protein